jgi:GTPase
VHKYRGLQRRRRRRAGLPVIAIVGYTNAGKSTLLNRLCNADVLAENRLFATLDPTTRRMALPSGKEVLFTDTVGFIQKLPTQLVAAFHATLEEVHEADILLHVVGVTDRNVLEEVAAVNEVLHAIEADGKPVIVALNKIDLLEDPEAVLSPRSDGRFAMRQKPVEELLASYKHVIPISAEQGVGIEELQGAIEEVLLEQMVEVDVVVPYRSGDLLNLWHRQGIVEAETYTPQGTRVRGRLPRWLVDMLTEEARVAMP